MNRTHPITLAALAASALLAAGCGDGSKTEATAAAAKPATTTTTQAAPPRTPAPAPRGDAVTEEVFLACAKSKGFDAEDATPQSITLASIKSVVPDAKGKDVLLKRPSKTGAEVHAFVIDPAGDVAAAKQAIDSLESTTVLAGNVVIAYGTPTNKPDFEAVESCVAG